MNQQSVPKKFIFNEKIDSTYLYDLYEDDYLCILDIIGTTLETLNDDFQNLRRAFETSNLDGLKKATHKIKPVFGFTGLLYHQEQLGIFETTCGKATSTAELSGLYKQLVPLVEEARTILETEFKRLTAYTG